MASLMATLGLDATSFHANADKAGLKAKSTGSEIVSAFTKVGGALGIGFGVVEIGSKIKERIKEIGEYGETIANLSNRLGIAVKSGQAWDTGLKLNGSSLQEQAKFFELVAVARQKALDGDSLAIRNFKDLKVSVADLKKERLEDTALRIADVFAKGDPQKLDAAFKAIGGRGAGIMVQAFRGGLTDIVKGAEGAGMVMGPEALDGLKESADRAKILRQQQNVQLSGSAAKVSGFLDSLKRWSTLTILILGDAMTGMHEAKKFRDSVMSAEKLLDTIKTKREEAAKTLVGGGVPHDELPKQAVKDQKELNRLSDELFRKQEENDLRKLGREGQILELNRRRADIMRAMLETESDKGRLQAQIDIEGIDEQIRKLTSSGSVEHFKSGHGGHMDVNALQRIGAYVGRTDDRTDFHRQILHAVNRLVDHSKPKTHAGWEHVRHS